MTEKNSQNSVQKSPGIVAAILFVATYFIARLILNAGGAASPLRVLAALLPVVPFAWLLSVFVSGVRTLDELEQRIQLEALAIAFPLTLILLLTLGLLEIAIDLPPEDFSYRHVWAMLPIFYFSGLYYARRRYS